jgi:L-alanine-DL-glutamate epimerase-like enolase superfamily enzyme
VGRYHHRRIPDPYERAALEAAALDLALRQAGTNLARLIDAVPEPVRYVVSFGRLADPLDAIRGEAPGVELKLDVDPAWDDATWAALGALGRVAVLDFKGGGTVADHERAHRAVPAALLEDPRPGDRSWSPSLRARVSVDGPLTSAAVLARLPLRPGAASVKPARMGGVLAALDLVAACATAGIPVYLGGMFEVGVGRRQLHALAALLSPDGPNDVAPLAVGTEPAARPARITVDAEAPGFA